MSSVNGRPPTHPEVCIIDGCQAKNNGPQANWRGGFGLCINHYHAEHTAFRRKGITRELYDDLLAEQGGVCGVCGSPPKRVRLHVDHDHSCCPGPRACGKCVRGLLCVPCNTAIEKVEAMNAYLERHRVRVG